MTIFTSIISIIDLSDNSRILNLYKKTNKHRTNEITILYSNEKTVSASSVAGVVAVIPLRPYSNNAR